jgi:hypothetical protein
MKRLLQATKVTSWNTPMAAPFTMPGGGQKPWLL